MPPWALAPLVGLVWVVAYSIFIFLLPLEMFYLGFGAGLAAYVVR